MFKQALSIVKANISHLFILLPVILYPYAWIIIAVVGIIILGIEDFISSIFWVIGICHALVLVSIILGIIYDNRAKVSELEAISWHIIVKISQFPGFGMLAVMFLFGCCLSVWGIGFVFLALTMFVMFYVTSGLLSLGVSIRLIREGHISIGKFIGIFLGSFIPILDYVIAVKLFVSAVKRSDFISHKTSSTPYYIRSKN